MDYQFPPRVDQLMKERMASGQYGSEDELLLKALRVLADHEESIADIQAGIEDVEAGRVQPLGEVDAELRKKHNISNDA